MKRATVYFKDGSYFICASSRTAKGFWVASRPYCKVDSAGLGDKVLEALSASRLGVEGPENTEAGLDSLIQPILDLSQSETWDEFVKGTTCCHISLKDDEIKAMPTKRSGQEFAHQPKLSVTGKSDEIESLLIKAFSECK